jgi:hypothetical protein
MTIRVKVEHMQPDYHKAITVEEQSVDMVGQAVPKGQPGYKHIVQPGESIELYVYSAQALVVTEGPDARPKPPTNVE